MRRVSGFGSETRYPIPDSMIDQPNPEGPPERQSLATDFQSLAAAPTPGEAKPPAEKRTDFTSLGGTAWNRRRRVQVMTVTDFMIDALTPIMIFAMVWSVVAFLLDIRSVFIGDTDKILGMVESGLQWVAFFFVMGIVALNRLIARDGKEESIIYIIGLALAIGLYTLVTSSQLGSVARGFLNKPFLAMAFNMGIVMVLWWVTNRLTHECCVDENYTAGDIGILTGTRQRLRKAFKGGFPALNFKENKPGPVVPWDKIEAVDPAELRKAKVKKPQGDPYKRLSKRHPGVSIFYASIPAMLIFAIGQRFLQGRDPGLMLASNVRVAAYTLTALMLLMLSSLGGLRQYFRSRRISVPSGIGPFWIGLGTVMVAAVMLGANWIPGPSLPKPIHVVAYSDHSGPPGGRTGDADRSGSKRNQRQSEYSEDSDQAGDGVQGDESAASDRGQEGGDQTQGGQGGEEGRKSSGRGRSSTSNLRPPSIPMPQPGGLLKALQVIVLVCMCIIGLLVLLRAIAMLASAIGQGGKKRDSLFARLANALSRFLLGATRLPKLPKIKRAPKVDRAIARSARFHNPLGDAALMSRMSPGEVVEYSYAALCALAEDAATPRSDDQTPYEFIRVFPETLKSIRGEATELTGLYVHAAYSRDSLDEATHDRLRRFWLAFEAVRGRIVR